MLQVRLFSSVLSNMKWYKQFTNSLNDSIDLIVRLLLIILCCSMTIGIKLVEQMLHMVSTKQWRFRKNASENDLAAKRYLLSIKHRYSICLITIEFLLNLFTRTLFDSIMYQYCVLLITIVYFTNFKCTHSIITFIRSDPQMDEISIVYFLLKIRSLGFFMFIGTSIGAFLLYINFIYYKVFNM
ncbi:hypothetical protein I4U23_009910 [Adineta vaga]|nr:hypothetical protein I4U23_009910 [Adineta vaga]